MDMVQGGQDYTCLSRTGQRGSVRGQQYNHRSYRCLIVWQIRKRGKQRELRGLIFVGEIAAVMDNKIVASRDNFGAVSSRGNHYEAHASGLGRVRVTLRRLVHLGSQSFDPGFPARSVFGGTLWARVPVSPGRVDRIAH